MRICVYCGSSPGLSPRFRQVAELLGRRIAERGIGLVYGGAQVGLMGAVADAALAAGGEVHGVIPTSMTTREIAHRGLTRLHVVDTMAQRDGTEPTDRSIGGPHQTRSQSRSESPHRGW